MTNCKVTYTFRCFECKKEEVKAFVWLAGQALPVPQLPRDWVSIGDQQFCGDHEIFVNVDREKNYPANMNARNKPKLVQP